MLENELLKMFEYLFVLHIQTKKQKLWMKCRWRRHQNESNIFCHFLLFLLSYSTPIIKLDDNVEEVGTRKEHQHFCILLIDEIFTILLFPPRPPSINMILGSSLLCFLSIARGVIKQAPQATRIIFAACCYKPNKNLRVHHIHRSCVWTPNL